MQPGDVVAGRYEVVGRLASGGMAEVFVADLRAARGVRRRVALKRIHPHLVEDATFAPMFLDEAKLASELRHPALVPVVDAAEDAGELVLVLEYVPGWDLGAVLKRARDAGIAVPEGVAVAILESLASALAYVHELRDERGAKRGIVHRDVTPSNVLVAEDGTVRLLDFGVAKAAARSAHTVTAALKGKIGYMAPEQASGAAVDGRTDLYALGLVAFEMLIGRRALSADGDIALLEEARNPSHVPVASLRADVGPALATLVDELRRVSPSDRPHSARIVADRLTSIRSNVDASAASDVRAFVERTMGSTSRPIQSATRPKAATRSALDAALFAAAGLSDDALDSPGTATRSAPDRTSSKSVEAQESAGADDGAIVGPSIAEPAVAHAPVVRDVGPIVVDPTQGTAVVDAPARWPWAVGVLFVVAAVGVSGWLIGTAALRDRDDAAPARSAVVPPPSATPDDVGFVRVVTDPPGATITVDGRATDETSPTVLSLASGSHHIEMTLADHTASQSAVTVSAGRTVGVRASLDRAPGRLTVRSRPDGATVTIDGREVGRTPLELGDLPRRDATVRVLAPGHAPHTETAPFATRSRHAVDVTLERREAFGTLDVSSSPWARVTVDGRAVADSTPVLGLRLAAGRHSVVLTNPALGWTERRSVTIREGERSSLVVRRPASP